MAKCRALNDDGMTAYHWCGSYRVPPATVTGSIQGDICLIESCMGVGEVAVSDHRSSAPTAVEACKDCQVGLGASAKLNNAAKHERPALVASPRMTPCSLQQA